MTHGDDQGLILPPRLAPIQLVIIPIYRDDAERSRVMPVVEQVKAQLAAFRVHVDDRDGMTPGFKYNDWEMRGVPVRIEIGPKDVEKNSVALARRDRPGKAGKSFRGARRAGAGGRRDAARYSEHAAGARDYLSRRAHL